MFSPQDRGQNAKNDFNGTLSAILFGMPGPAFSCPNFSGMFRPKGDTAGVTLKYAQHSCAGLKVTVFINGAEQPDPTIYLADGVFRAKNTDPHRQAYYMSFFTSGSLVSTMMLANFLAEQNKIEMMSVRATSTISGKTLVQKLEYFDDAGLINSGLGGTSEFERIGD